MYKIITIEYKDKSSFVYLDNQEVIEIPMAVFFDFNLSIHQMIEEDTYQRILEAKSNYAIKEYINRILTKRDVSSFEISSLLQSKFNLNDTQIEQALLPYKKAGLIDDIQFLKEKIPTLLEHNYGYHRVVVYLEQKGFSKAVVDEAYLDEFSALEREKATQVALKYLKLKKKPAPKLLSGLIQRLTYCGYKEDLVKEIVTAQGFSLDE